MYRRTVLATTGLSITAPLVGCLDETETETERPADEATSNETTPDSNGGTDAPRTDAPTDEGSTAENASSDAPEDRAYEQCHLVSIDYESLPEEIRNEVDAALENGRYTADPLHFDEAIDPGRSYLVVDDTPYDSVVEDGDEGQGRTLELHETDVVKAPEPRVIFVENDDDRDHEVRIELTGDETLVDKTVPVPADEMREIEATDRFGTYELIVRVRTGHEATDTFGFSVDDSHFAGLVGISDSDVFVTQEVAGTMPCLWDGRHS